MKVHPALSLLGILTLGSFAEAAPLIDSSCWVDPSEVIAVALKPHSETYGIQMRAFVMAATDTHYNLRPEARARKLHESLTLAKRELDAQLAAIPFWVPDCFAADLNLKLEKVSHAVDAHQFKRAAGLVQELEADHVRL